MEFDKTAVVSLVLEADGTTVDDSEYFSTLPDNTVFLLLQDTERWLPPEMDMVRAALSCIPRIVCQTMESMDLRQEAPCWKIADNRGQITILLQWGNAQITAGRLNTTSPNGHRTQIVVSGIGETPLITRQKSPSPPPLPPHNYSLEHSAPTYSQRISASPNPRTPPPPPPLPHIRLARQSSSLESGADPSHTSSASGMVGGQYQENQYDTAGYLRTPGPSQCDFHCCSMHSEGGLIRLKKSSATSPIQSYQSEQQVMNNIGCSSVNGLQSGRRSVGHVRFEDVVKDGAHVTSDKRFIPNHAPHIHRHQSTQQNVLGPQHNLHHHYHQHQLQAQQQQQSQQQQQQQQQQHLHQHHQHQHHHHNPQVPSGDAQRQPLSIDVEESSESEGDNTLNEEVKVEKTLQLVDQLSVERNKYLTIKDIGIILERLNSKIIDVQSMERRKESNDCRCWILRATIRGESLGDMGVIYRGHYHSIGEYSGITSNPVPLLAAPKSESQTVVHPGIQ